MKMRAIPGSTGFTFPVEWTSAVLVLALMSICMVLALFAYLNHRTKKSYFTLWIAAWTFYAVYLAAAIGLQESPNFGVFVMLRRACIGLSALFMFWGSFHLTGNPRSMKELKLGTVMILVWSGVAAFIVRDRFWITMPVFALLAAAGGYTGVAYFLRRRTYRSATILGVGFLLWGAHLVAFPFLEQSQTLMTIGYLVTAVLAIMIAVGMIVEQEVNTAEQSYRALFDSSSDAMFLVDILTLQILESNAAAERITKHAAADLVGRPFVEICPALQQAKSGAAKDNALRMFNAVFRPFSEFPIFRSDGTTINCEGDTTLVQWRQRAVLQVNVRDVSERRKVGQQLRRAEKLSALGQLIAGVAHELNNPLAVVMGTAQVLVNRDNLDVKSREEIKRIFNEADRASKIVGDLLSFARPADPQKAVVDINRLVSSVLETQEASIQAAGIRLETRLAKDLPRTMADHAQVEQVLVNLISNAVYALSTHHEPRILTIQTGENGQYISITVTDNGPGIPAKVLAQVFDPFFTTKPLGKGTGLGLTISNTIIQEHRGKLMVDSKPDAGAKFTIELPVIDCPAGAPVYQRTAEVVKPSTQQAQRSVLIVDDEPGIVEVLREVISEVGHKVATATNGSEAMERIKSGTYDIILSDMRMPGMDGAKLYESVKGKDENLAHRIVFVTGDTVSADTREFLVGTGCRWLSKPFTIQQILNTVTEVLESGPVAA
jgi:PAS domain S-box-containing protein